MTRSAQDELAAHDPGRSRAPQPFHRQSAGHDAAGIRRGRARSWKRSIWATWSAARSPGARQVLAQHTSQLDTRRRPADGCRLDPVLFEQVLFNLLDNAAKYAPPEPTITLDARRATATASRCRSPTKGDGIAGRATANACSTNSTACRPPTADAPAPGWGWRSAAALSKRWAAPSRPPIAADRRGRGVHHHLAVAGSSRQGMPHERRSRNSTCWSSTTNRRSGASCAPA